MRPKNSRQEWIDRRRVLFDNQDRLVLHLRSWLRDWFPSLDSVLVDTVPPDTAIRKPFQYSLRRLLAAFIIGSMLLAVAAPIVRTLEKYRKEAESLSYYEKLGAFYDDVSGWGLDLQGKKITSQQLELLPGLFGLRVLSLRNTPIDDEAIQFLQQCTGLVWIDLDETNVSINGIRRLRESLPQCEVEWSPSAGTR